MEENATLNCSHPAFGGLFGVARRDITPPLGIHSRMWGSSRHDVAEGIHRPLTATAMALRVEGSDRTQVLVSLDLGWWRSLNDEWFVRGPILDEFQLDPADLLLHLTHTHAGPTISLHAVDKPGGDKIRPYLEQVRGAVIEAIREAMTNMRFATLAWHTGRCQLACNRDQPNPLGQGTIVGYVPEVAADDTLLVGRLTDESGHIMAVLVNYACHPTTLGGGNRLISPDYVGAMRELVERETGGAPCLFLNGAAGDLAPRRQYSDDVEIADQNGRQLGHAVLATLADMLPHGCALAFDHVEESVARLGHWLANEQPIDGSCQIQKIEPTLPLCAATPSEQSATQRAAGDRATVERVERMMHWRKEFGDRETAAMPIWLWRLGNVLLVGSPAEMHSPFQIELRRQFADHAVVVMNVVNGSYAYLPPRADFAHDTYQCNTTLFEPGAHETVLAATIAALQNMVESPHAVTP